MSKLKVNELDTESGTTITVAAGKTLAGTDIVDTAQIATDAITANEIAANAVDTSEIAANAVSASELKSDALSGQTFSGNVTLSGNLTVSGTTTTVSSTTITVADPLLALASTNTAADAVDIGFYGKYVESSTTKYLGLAWDADQTEFILFEGNQAVPTTTVNKSGTGFVLSDLRLGTIHAATVDGGSY